MWKYEQEFRIDKPETVGETDKHFDLDNYKDWLEEQLTDCRKQLSIHSVVPSYYQVVQETRKLGLQEVTSGFKTLDEAKKAMKQNEQWFNKMYIIARIDN